MGTITITFEQVSISRSVYNLSHPRYVTDLTGFSGKQQYHQKIKLKSLFQNKMKQRENNNNNSFMNNNSL
jgi:hypothetical protein